MSTANFRRARTTTAGLLRLAGVLLLLIGVASLNFSRWGVAPPSIAAERHENRVHDSERFLKSLKARLPPTTQSPTPPVTESPTVEQAHFKEQMALQAAPSASAAGASLPHRGEPLVLTGSLAPPSHWEECAVEHFGSRFLERWRAAGQEYCHANRSHFVVHDIFQARREQTSQFATFKGAVLAQGKVYLECHMNTKQHGVWGSILGAAAWKNQIYFDPWPVAVGPGFKDNASITLLAVRDCNAPYNPFHCFTDLVAAFYIIEMYQLKYNDTRIVFIDNQPEGNFWELWRALSPNL